MRAYAVDDITSEMVSIYVVESEELNGRKLMLDSGGHLIVVDPAQDGPVYFRVPRPIADALGIVTVGHKDASPSTDGALADAIDVRDRVLSLLETIVSGPDWAKY